MPFTLTCPHCDAELTIPDEVAGKKIRCKACSEVLRADPPIKKKVTKPAPDEDDEEDERPAKKSVQKRSADDDEPRPQKSKKRKAAKEQGNSKMLFLIGVPVALVVLSGVGVGIAYFAGSLGSEPKDGLVSPPIRPDKTADTRDYSEHVTASTETLRFPGRNNVKDAKVSWVMNNNAAKFDLTYYMVTLEEGGSEVTKELPDSLNKNNGSILFLQGKKSGQKQLWIARKNPKGTYVRVSNIVIVDLTQD